MRLHNDEKAFREIITVVSQETKIHEEQIEKDYYVSMLLKEIKENAPEIVFKGGTSLSKCYDLIKRFSEDIDINIKENTKPTQGQMKELKKQVITSIENMKLELTNLDDIGSTRAHNIYKVKFPNLIQHTGNMKETLEIETFLMYKSFPCEKMMVSNYITQYLIDSDNTHLIEAYDLQAFEIKVQAIERTFIDKVFAIMDYIETDRIERNSRHLYDLHMIWNKFKDDLCSDKEKFKELFDSVVLERSQKPTINVSAQHGYQIKNKLSEIIFHHPYINDYKEITVGLMYKDADVIPYESTIVSLNEIMESGLFPEVVELQIAEV